MGRTMLRWVMAPLVQTMSHRNSRSALVLASLVAIPFLTMSVMGSPTGPAHADEVTHIKGTEGLEAHLMHLKPGQMRVLIVKTSGVAPEQITWHDAIEGLNDESSA